MVEELDAVVWRRIVGCADDRAGHEVVRFREVGEPGRRDVPDKPDLRSDRAKPGGKGALEHPAAPPGVAPDHHRVAVTAKDMTGRPAEPEP